MKTLLIRSGIFVVLINSIITIAACTLQPAIPQIRYDNIDFAQAQAQEEPELPVRLVPLPQPLPLPAQLKLARKRQVKDIAANEGQQPEARISDANKAAKVEPSGQGYINAIQNYAFVKGALYQLYAAVNQVSDIALEPGEKLTSVSAGDTVRWVVGDTTSGDDGQTQVHILVKPIASDLQTNLVITTDRRTYHLEMHSSDKTYMASISWVYPHSDLLALKKRNTRVQARARHMIDAGLNLGRLKFRYRIVGDAPWKPVRAFDDGEKVFLQFPSGLRQGEAPPLFVVGAGGQPALVNYRVKDNYYIVDRLFAAAELRLGTDPQQIVRIIRSDATSRRTRSTEPDWGFGHDR